MAIRNVEDVRAVNWQDFDAAVQYARECMTGVIVIQYADGEGYDVADPMATLPEDCHVVYPIQ